MRAKYLHLAACLGEKAQVPADRSRAPSQTNSHEEALLVALEETQVDLSTSRVRVGLTRGHLLEIVVQVPMDVHGDDDALQVASEVYCEGRLGEAVLDDWVACISVDRIARTKGLLTVFDVAVPSASLALQDVVMLVSRGVEGVRRGLPESVLSGDFQLPGWTALDIPEAASALQADRRHASTLFPEALKCALEGLPFSSARFTLGPEAFAWLRFEIVGNSGVRLKRRGALEHELQDAPRLLFCGSGFGLASDYFDVWVDLEHPSLPKLLERLAREYGNCEFGVYDSSCSAHPLQLRGGRGSLDVTTT